VMNNTRHKKMVSTQEQYTLIEKDHPGDRSPEKDCCWRLTFRQPVRKPSSESFESLSQLKIQNLNFQHMLPLGSNLFLIVAGFYCQICLHNQTRCPKNFFAALNFKHFPMTNKTNLSPQKKRCRCNTNRTKIKMDSARGPIRINKNSHQ